MRTCIDKLLQKLASLRKQKFSYCHLGKHKWCWLSGCKTLWSVPQL